VIADELLAEVYAHARATFPAECCGYLTDRRVVRCTNVAASEDVVAGRGDDTAFAIGGAELLAFARSFDGPEPAHLVYHSHTNGRAYFSAVDRELATAYPVEHLVVGITAEGVHEAARFDRELREVERWGMADLAAAVDHVIAGGADWERRWQDAAARARAHAVAGGLVGDLSDLQTRLAAVPVSDEARAAHDDYVRPRKYVRGVPPRSDARVPSLWVATMLRRTAPELAYAAERFRNPGPCDCAILVRLQRRDRRPSAPLRDLDGDGMYWNDWVCEACGQRWTEHKDCDDVGVWSSWEATC